MVVDCSQLVMDQLVGSNQVIFLPPSCCRKCRCLHRDVINMMQLFQVFVTISSNCMEVDLLPHVLRVIFKIRRKKKAFSRIKVKI